MFVVTLIFKMQKQRGVWENIESRYVLEHYKRQVNWLRCQSQSVKVKKKTTTVE